MKPEEWLQDLAKGEWWLPSAPDERVPGILVSREGRLRLELIGSFGEPLSRNQYPVICGWLASGGEVTLFNCHGSVGLDMPGMATEKCSFARAIKGYHFSNLEQAKFRSLTAHIANLASWLGPHGLQVRLSFDDAKFAEWSAVYKPVQPIELQLSHSQRIEIHFTVNIPGMGPTPSISMREDCLVEVLTDCDQEISALHDRVYAFELFAELLSGLQMTTTLGRVVHSEVLNDSGKPAGLPVKANFRPSSDVQEPVSWTDIFIPYSEVRESFQDYLDKWLTLYDSLGAVVPASLVNKAEHPLEMQFLLLANAIHRYAETKSGCDRMDFADAMEEIIPLYCTPDAFKRARALLTDSRHYYTHYNPGRVEKAARGADLRNLTDLLEMVNRLYLLESIGFERERLMSWVSKSLHYREHLSMSRWMNV
jgi:hypothetical protein